MQMTRVWVIGQHPLVIDYLIQVLTAEQFSCSVGTDKTFAKDDALPENPVFVIDSGSLEDQPSRYIKNIGSRIKDAKFIVLDHQMDVYKVCQLLSLGIQGFLTYNQVADSLALAVRSLSEGGMWVDSRVLQRYMRVPRRERQSFQSSEVEPLTTREEEILHLTRQRYSNKEIAMMLNVEVSTVKFHLSNIFAKLQVTGRSDLWRTSPQATLIPFPQAI